MKINKQLQDGNLVVALEGRLDTTTAPELEAALDYSDLKSLTFDFKDLVYISSAGLRVLLTAQKAMNAKGGVVVKNSNESILEVFEMTGFSDLLTLQ